MILWYNGVVYNSLEAKKIKNKIKVRHLLHKSKSGVLRGIFSRATVIILFFLIQLFFIVESYIWLEQYRYILTIFEAFFAVAIVLYLVNSEMDATSRGTWLILVMVAPLLGALLFIYTKLDWGYRGLKRRINQLVEASQPYLQNDEQVIKEVKDSTSTTYHLVQYLQHTRAIFPVYGNTKTTFFPSGESFFKVFKEKLLAAENYIFIEFFIIGEGRMWGEVLNILERKVKEGVEVRVLYDGMNELSRLSTDYAKRLRHLGIMAKSFLPISPFISTYYNYRDHRKIVVIDGEIAFTGGVNLADEYINEIDRFGHWVDTAIMLEGQAVDSFLVLFLQMWSITEKEMIIEPYLGNHFPPQPTDGYVIPYGDSPLDTDKVGENVYIDILNHAKDYVYIMTPYLILDGELEHAIRFASERGVDVRIIMPGIADKKIAYYLAKTYYKSLMSSGVTIYEYKPGFVHAKVFVSDDVKAVVGSINLDYRSLYHHFECATYLYRSSTISDIYQAFLDTQAKCQKVTPEEVQNRPLYQKLIGLLVKTIAPLL